MCVFLLSNLMELELQALCSSLQIMFILHFRLFIK